MKEALIISLKNPIRKNKVGGQQDILGRVLALHKLGYHVDIIAIDNKDQLQNDTKLPDGVNLYLYEKKFNLNKLIKYPIATATRFQDEIVSFLQQKKYDISICESEFLYVYWQLGLVQSKRSFLRMHNVESEYYTSLASSERNLLKKILYNIDSYRLKSLEKGKFLEVEKLLFISNDEYNRMDIAHNRKDILPAIFPIYTQDIEKNIASNNNSNILIFGDFTLEINKNGLNWFLKSVWPKIIEKNPSIKLNVVGKGSESYKNDYNLHTLGYVEDLKSLFDSFQIVAIPLLEGAGVKIKLVESLLRRKTIITTSKGVEGTELLNNTHLFVADNPTDFAEYCIYALENMHESKLVAENGFNFAKDIYTIEGHASYLDKLLS
ncbi:glycosyltransferase family 4 protein [Niallia circulans]|uniref:glycosyltransferase n=1 Tax=Niallia circulans TaxID=1397 RepID=UPI00148FDCC8|nr:glycosyltransferase [Niallia circulans]QJX64158.1 glycosyltransferase family 4 protein [Niallia circulans]